MISIVPSVSDNIIGEVLTYYPVWKSVEFNERLFQKTRRVHPPFKETDMRQDTAKSGKKSKKLIVKKGNPVLEQLNLDAAGIDVGSESHYVSVAQDRDEQPVREFKSFIEDLHTMANWLHACQVKTIAMESTAYTGFQFMKC